MCPSKSYEAAAEWAERDATLPARSATALRGDDAAEFGRSVVARALGRPSIDPGAKPGEQAPRRQVRLPRAVSDQIDRIAAIQGRSASDVMREAITTYVERAS